MDEAKDDFKKAATPLRDRAIFRIYRKDDTLEGHKTNAVNFNHIIETGKIPSYASDLDKYQSANQYIDWESDDAFTHTLGDIEQKVFAEIEKHPGMVNLLEKEKWTYGDRRDWERHVSEIVSDVVKKTPGFEEYRIGRDGARRAIRLNDLSEDIENGTKNIEFDCETMSVVEGILLQKVDNALLPETASEGLFASKYRGLSADYKQGGNYFHASGGITFNDKDGDAGGHTFIVTPLGNIVESTDYTLPEDQPWLRSKTYIESAGAYSLEKLARGENFIGKAPGAKKSVYGSWQDKSHAATRQSGGTGISQETMGQFGNNFYPGIADDALFLDEQNLAIDATVLENGDMQLSVHQKIDIGTPQEGYMRVADDYKDRHALEQDCVNPSTIYQDRLNGKTYKFDVTLGEDHKTKISAYEKDAGNPESQFHKIGGTSDPHDTKPDIAPDLTIEETQPTLSPLKL